MRYLIDETNEIQTRKMWRSTDEEVSKAVAKKGIQPLDDNTPPGRKSKSIPQMGNRLFKLGVFSGSAFEK